MALKFSKLHRKAIRNLKSGCIKEHGITFERLKNGDGRYSANFMVDRQRIHRVIGHESDGTTRTQAEEFIAKARQDAKTGRLNLTKGRKTALSFNEAAEKYIERSMAEGGKDIKMKVMRLRMHLVPFFTGTPLSKITSFNIERYKKHRLQEEARRGGRREVDVPSGPNAKKVGTIKPATINRELAALSHLFTKAMEWGWIDRKPAVIRRLTEDRGRLSYLTADQAERLLAAAMEDANPYVHAFIMIGLKTGMRRTEILSIKRQHIDLEKLEIHIPRAKAGSRQQPITKPLASYLEGYLNGLPSDQEWLFPSPTSRSGRTVDIRKAFRRAVIAAGLDPEEVVRHTLRHTAITHLVQAGVDLPTVMRISGHKTLIMVGRYAHQSGSHIQIALDKLEESYKKVA